MLIIKNHKKRRNKGQINTKSTLNLLWQSTTGGDHVPVKLEIEVLLENCELMRHDGEATNI